MIYPYICKDCNDRFCLHMPIGIYVRAKEKVICPYCFSRNTTRIYEPVPVIYKDSDFTKYNEGE